MSAYEIEAALAEIFDAEQQKADFIQWCELMESEYGGHNCPTF